MDFHLVQRIKRSLMHNEPITELSHLEADYMGSSEFEFGALPNAYKTMKKQGLAKSTVQVSAFNSKTTLYVVSSVDQIDSLEKRFQEWFDGNMRGKEYTNLDRAITRKEWDGVLISDEDFSKLPVAWWALKENIFFSLDENIAGMWLRAMRNSSEDFPIKAGTMMIL